MECMRRLAGQQAANQCAVVHPHALSGRCSARISRNGRPGPVAGGLRSRRVVARSKGDDEEPDWDKEMSIFKQRMMRPNQLATLRELESKVSVGKVGLAWVTTCVQWVT